MSKLDLPEVGQPAPDFTTLDQNENTVSLKDFRGKTVVLYFYPKAMTPGCTVQACGIRDTQKEFKNSNTVVLGISPDAPARLQKFIDKHELNFTLLSDEEHKIADDYGVWALKKFMGKEYEGIHRLTFIIDAKGVLRHIMEKVKTKTHHDDVLEVLKNL
jgi:peroxiredoxin Q/BCP